jgi:hypothetical protein
MKYFWMFSAIAWCTMTLLTKDNTYLACMYGCLILMNQEEDKER